MIRTRLLSLATLLVFASIVAPTGGISQAPSGENVVRAEISGLRSDRGSVMCSIYASAEGFPKDPAKAVSLTKSPVSNGQALCEFPGLHPGRYAVSVFHDENGNGKLDSNFLGIPKEGVGASNNAKGRFGPPKFNDAEFDYQGGKLGLKITVAYF